MPFLDRVFGLVIAGIGVGTATLAALALYMALANPAPLPPPATAALAATPDAGETAPAETAAAAPQPAAAEASGDAVDLAAGEKAFRQCKSCHSVDQGGKNMTGPNLWNVVGRGIGSVEGFSYSDAVAAHQGESWTEEALDAYLAKPKDFIPGNKMSFAGLRKPEDRRNLIGWLGQQSDNPAPVQAAAAPVQTAQDDAPASDAEEAVEIEQVWPEDVTYRNPPARTAEEQAAIDEKVAALTAEVEGIDYERARFHRLHFPPEAAQASNEECLVCHQDVVTHEVREASPAGVSAADSIAWYQTLDTYDGAQASFHYRHLESDFAKQVMNLQCSFCHAGNDPREESPDMVPTRAAFTADATPEFTLRKMVNPSTTCLRCHGAMPNPEEIMGLAGPWHEVREDLEYPEAPNGCLSCHAESFRTVRHNVSYLNALTIEEMARVNSSDTCYGCHGGRKWYRISYPYPRHTWPMLFEDEAPEWAQGRPAESDEAYRLQQSQLDSE